MANSKISAVFCFAVIVLMAGIVAAVYGSETLPWGVERIRAYCEWDNNRDMVVDPSGANGTGIYVAVIDSGIDYEPDPWNYSNKIYHLIWQRTWLEEEASDMRVVASTKGMTTKIVRDMEPMSLEQSLP